MHGYNTTAQERKGYQTHVNNRVQHITQEANYLNNINPKTYMSREYLQPLIINIK